MSGRRVNKEGEVRDENGDVMGRLTTGDLGHCVGLEVDDNGYVVDNDGNKVGEVTLIENIIEDEEIPEEELTEEEKEERRKKEQDREIAEKMGAICTQTLERVQPICKQITDVSAYLYRLTQTVTNLPFLYSTSKPPTVPHVKSWTRKIWSTKYNLLSKRLVVSCKSATAPCVASTPTVASLLKPRVVQAPRRPLPRSTALPILSRS